MLFLRVSECSQGRREGAEHIPMLLLREPRWPDCKPCHTPVYRCLDSLRSLDMTEKRDALRSLDMTDGTPNMTEEAHGMIT